MTAPIPIRVLRYKCPHCGRSASRPSRTREHMARCWHNPEARGCKTCKHFEAYGPEWGDSCGKDVDLTGRPACKTCGGYGTVPGDWELGMTECPDCAGDGGEIKPGPMVGCAEWEPKPRCQEPTCPDYGDPDFGEATCPTEHAEPRTDTRRPA